MKKIDRASTVQDPYFERLIDEKCVVDVWFDNGDHIEGIVLSHDIYAFLLGTPSGKRPPRLLRKSLVSLIRPKEPFVQDMRRAIIRPYNPKRRVLDLAYMDKPGLSNKKLK